MHSLKTYYCHQFWMGNSIENSVWLTKYYNVAELYTQTHRNRERERENIHWNLIINLNLNLKRCKIPECDFPPLDDYLPMWTRFAVPHSHNVPSKCLRYESIPLDSHNKRKSNNCDEMFFNDSYSVSCTEFIYKTDEVTILKEVRDQRLFGFFFHRHFVLQMKLMFRW